ncbi:hypothetical protein NA57DRAFT_74693 [Rhizodiscina lignyota]|uniref:2EXR domain-containing protein n=1 Tax=Rhizodiscina lignyota TaxID=1504668 RepID=A0A9P4IGE1_9PEZI|nr:hypothetical protein NA57DRAFT_74693 [Rhizodiscina lignyota]
MREPARLTKTMRSATLAGGMPIKSSRGPDNDPRKHSRQPPSSLSTPIRAKSRDSRSLDETCVSIQTDGHSESQQPTQSAKTWSYAEALARGKAASSLFPFLYTFPFLELPAELRNRVYDYLIPPRIIHVKPVTWTLSSKSDDGWDNGWSESHQDWNVIMWTPPLFPAIVHTNQQLRSETFPLVIGNTIFDFYEQRIVGRCLWADPMSHEALSHIKHISISHCMLGRSYDDGLKALSYCFNLETMQIDLDFPWRDKHEHMAKFDLSALTGLLQVLLGLEKPQIYLRCRLHGGYGESCAFKSHFAEMIVDLVRQVVGDSDGLEARVMGQFHYAEEFCWDDQVKVEDVCDNRICWALKHKSGYSSWGERGPIQVSPLVPDEDDNFYDWWYG